MILLTIEELQPTPILTLVARMARDTSQITCALKALETKGVGQRQHTAEDGRVVMTVLTEYGTRMVEVLHDTLAETIHGILSLLSPADQAKLGALLDRVAHPPAADYLRYALGWLLRYTSIRRAVSTAV
jgi:DNA-binding MarR family transcriptional regulator